ncbi:MAG TPA: anti-sigma factor, partial [Puia sp.]|nr:anti-sigma factor [Puia sp.]
TEIFSKLRPEVIGDGNAHAEKQTETALVVPIRGVRYVAVASIVLLIASTLLNYYFFTQYKEYSIKYQQLVLNQTQVASANEILQTKLQDYESILNLIKNPAMAIVKMPGTPKSPSPSSLTTIYWDTRSKDVYLLVNNLPQPESNKQYQLWALVNGKPVDAGVFEFNTDSLSLIKMKTIPKAQAFAITLEKRGGSLTPTMPIYVLGKTS